MGTKIMIPVYVDAYFTNEGVGIYVATDGDGFTEKIIPFKEIMHDYIDMHLVPSTPPTMHDKDRQQVVELINNLLSAIDYLRKLEHDTPTWTKNNMGHRD